MGLKTRQSNLEKGNGDMRSYVLSKVWVTRESTGRYTLFCILLVL